MMSQETSLANFIQKRFRAEFRPAFEAWLATNPFNNPNALPGPLFMPQYKLSLQEKAPPTSTKICYCPPVLQSVLIALANAKISSILSLCSPASKLENRYPT